MYHRTPFQARSMVRNFPSPSRTLETPVEALPDLFEYLAIAAGYSLSMHSARMHLKLALYAFALSPESPFHRMLFPDGTSTDIGDDWNLAQVQGQSVGGEYSESRRGKACGHVFRGGESVYRCRECAVDPTCVLCSKCFHGSSHAKLGHDVTLSVHSGSGAGCCDCGDAEAFKDGCHTDCKYHSANLGPAHRPTDSVELQELRAAVAQLLTVLLDWMVSVLESSPTDMVPPKTVEDIVTASTLSPTGSGSASSGGESSSPPTYVSSTSRGKARADAPLVTPAGPWSVVLWNDEKHSFDQVIEQVRSATGVSRREASDVAQRVDAHGRDIIYVSQDPEQLLAVSKHISDIALAVTVRSSMETFYEQVAGELVPFMKDLCTAKINEDSGTLMEVVAEVLLGEYGQSGLSRFQKLVGVDSRLWKAARKGLTELYVMLLGVNQTVKVAMSSQFAQVYSNVAETYLLSDREFEHSVITLGVQVFTVPSVSANLINEHEFFTQVIMILYAFFTGQVDSATGKHLVLPPQTSVQKIVLKPDTFNDKRYFQIFNDLGHLISSQPVHRIVREKTGLANQFITFLDLFTSMNPSERAVDTHIEYESDIWVTAFNVTIQLGKACRSFGEAFRQAPTSPVVHALSQIIAFMLVRDGSRQTHLVTFGPHEFTLVQFDVARDPVSFHHPLGWLFAEIAKSIEALDSQALASAGYHSINEALLTRIGRSQIDFLSALDHPLRAQIRAGLWVRNGFGMRAQQLHYKEYSLRENTYDQDVYFMQMALLIVDPSLVFAAILDRFALIDWIATSDASHDTYEPQQAIAMAEEMLYLLIVMLSDTTYAAGLSDQTALQREIVHNLCLGPCQYSELMRRVSEKYADDPSLDRILGQVSQFKQPVGVADQGTYTLRPEYFSEVNPYFPRYTRNQREEAEKIVREQLKKATDSNSEPVIIPKALNITNGPFVGLAAAFESDVLHRIIFYSLKAGHARTSTNAQVSFSEVLVDEALHLTMLALIERPDSFAKFAASPAPRDSKSASSSSDATLIHLLAKIETDERTKAVWHKARWCLDRFAEVLGSTFDVNACRTIEDNSAAKALDAKRAAAKARQNAIMQKFAQAQQSFLDNVLDEDDDDEDADEDMEDTVSAPVKPSLGSCIVCQDELDDSQAFGVLALVQASNFLRVTPSTGDENLLREVLATPSSLDSDASSLRPFGIAGKRLPVSTEDDSGDGISQAFPQSTQTGLYASACGHMMHLACFDTYYKSVEQRHHTQPVRNHPENIHRREFVCPLCKSLGNVLLPYSVDIDSQKRDTATTSSHGLAEWSQAMRDPLQDASDQGVPVAFAEEILQKARNLNTVPSTEGYGLKPWRISLSLPSMFPQDFSSSPIPQMVGRLLAVLDPLKQEIGGARRLPFTIPGDLLAYTVSSLEAAGRGSGEDVDEVTQATVRMLKSFILVLNTLVQVQLGADPDKPDDTAAMAIYPHLGGIFAQSSQNADFFRLSPLTTLIEVAVVKPEWFRHVVVYAFYTELVKTFLNLCRLQQALSISIDATPGFDEAEASEYEALASIRPLFMGPENQTPSAPSLGRLLYAYMLPFLRRAMIVTTALGGNAPRGQASDKKESEFKRLLSALDIPPPSEVFATLPDVASPAVQFIRQHIVALRDSIPGWRLGSDSNGVYGGFIPDHLVPPGDVSPLLHPGIYELIGLPQQLDTLTAVGLHSKCERCGTVPDDPGLCLLCGDIVCCQSFCCMDSEEEAQHGECNTHMWTCGGTVGLYYMIKRNSILYLYTDKGSFSTPPYLDSHGEVDFGGRRGRNQFPQFLHPGRYDEIRKAWLTHGIPTFVARKLDATTDHGGWTTM